LTFLSSARTNHTVEFSSFNVCLEIGTGPGVWLLRGLETS
jgi:hypothetical protein